MKIKEVTWNWSPACMESYGERIDCYSDTDERANINDTDVLDICEVYIDQYGKPHYDIYYINGDVKSIFNPNTVTKTQIQ